MTSTRDTSALILVASPREEVRKANANTLQNAGFQVIESITAPGVLDKARAERPAVIIIDAVLISGAGQDLLSQLKNDSAAGHSLILQIVPPHAELLTSPFADNQLQEPVAPDQLVGAVTILVRLANAERELRGVDSWKKDFLATLAHELRNPLAPILNSVELLCHLDPVVPALQQKARNTIKLQTKTLALILEDLNELDRASKSLFADQTDVLENINDSSVATPLTTAEIPTEPQLEPQTTKRVLVVDDNVAVADTLTQWLAMGGHDVKTAYTGAQAVEYAAQFQPDVVLLDLGLPDSSGFDIASKLRALPDLKQFLLVAVTGYGQAALRKSVLEAGFDEHFAKPMSFDKLGSIGLHV